MSSNEAWALAKELSGRKVGAVTCCAWAPSGTQLATASGDAVRVWDVNTGIVVARLQGHAGDVRSCAFSPDGTRIASASDDRTVRVWDWTWTENTGSEVGRCRLTPGSQHMVSTLEPDI